MSIASLMAALESNWADIKQEYLAIPSVMKSPWVDNMYNQGWNIAGLYAGRYLPDTTKDIQEDALRIQEHCPRTMALLGSEPSVRMAAFSCIGPGTHIYPHKGYTSAVLRLHLGVIVPPSGCAIRVGEETFNWQDGKCILFDDMLEHEAWNHSDSERVVLLVDVRRPRGGPKGGWDSAAIRAHVA